MSEKIDRNNLQDVDLPVSPPAEDSEQCVVVGIGASAGGLKDLSRFLQAMDADSGMAIVIIQHLDPDHESHMSDLLGRHTAMEVVEVSEPCPLQANRVYVIPPGKYLSIKDRCLVLEEPTTERGMRMPVDYFFRSLAEQCRERSICIVLTGTGSDGTQGLQEVKEAGGLTIAQDPDSAEYDGMPRSVIASGMVDLTLPIAEIPKALSDFLSHPYFQGEVESRHLHESSPNQFQSIISHLHARTGYDFRCYKKGTLHRRIQRRMGLRRLEDASAYLKFLRDDADEVNALFNDLLIGVTRFFRDREIWETVTEKVIRPLVKKKKSGENLRIWIAGCSTGEEAYTMAILVVEEIERQKKEISFQLFATDLSQDAIKIARIGIYPASISLDLTQERLDRFFTQEGERFQVSKKVREYCIFAAQNLISDPPFSNLDIVSCRNLLIYLERSVQEKISKLFHFALSPDGILLLGSSESITNSLDIFDPISKSSRIYRKIKRDSLTATKIPTMPRPKPPQTQKSSPPINPNNSENQAIVEFVSKVLLDHYAPASLLVNSDYVIQYYHGALAPYLNTPSGQPSKELFANLARYLEGKVRGLIRAARLEGKIIHATVQSPAEEEAPVRVSVEPIQQKNNSALFLITFQEIVEGRNSAQDSESGSAMSVLSEEDVGTLRQLEYELGATREDQQSTTEELEASNEELQASNEELQASNEEVMSTNEELQSTNEELESSREELQSLNEELSTVNSQLGEKIGEVETSNNDLTNLISSTRIATIFLDSDLRIRRFTPPCRDLLHIIPTDEGRPISDLSSRISDDTLLKDARTVLANLQVSEKEVLLDDAGWFLRRIMPFRTSENQIAGVVITLTDIGAVKESYRALEVRERQQACVARLGQLAVKKDSRKELFDRATESLVEAFGVEMANLLQLSPNGESLVMVNGVGWDQKLIGDGIVPAGSQSQAGFALQQNRPVIVADLSKETRFHGHKLLNDHQVKSGMSMVLGSPDKPWGVLSAHSTEKRDFGADDVNFISSAAHILTEVIERDLVLDRLEESEERLKIAKEATNLGTHDFDVQNNRVLWDKRSRELWGVSMDEDITYQTFIGGVHEADRVILQEKVDELLDPKGSHDYYHEFRVISREDKNKIRWIAACAKSFFRDGKIYRTVGTHQDITDKRVLIEQQALWAERLEEQVIERTSVAERRAEDLHQLASQITNSEERARRKVAQVIHDDVQQLIIAAKMRLAVEPGETVSADELQIVSELLDKTLSQARSLVSELSPPVLQDGDFDKALAWLANHFEETHRLKVRLETEGDLQHLDESLATLLFNVVRELLFNAVKHSGEDNAGVKVQVMGKSLEIKVEDGGKGFNVPERTAEGKGFGLFSIEERIRAFGGTMLIDSIPGEGARFVVTVPLTRRMIKAPSNTAAGEEESGETLTRRAKGKRLRILIADDHEVVREGLARIISQHLDFEIVAAASDGAEAIQMARALQPDLVLMDISMPNMNGIEATKEIKRQRKETVVIGISLHEKDILGEAMRQAGASAFIQKDEAGENLINTIRQLFPCVTDGDQT